METTSTGDSTVTPPPSPGWTDARKRRANWFVAAFLAAGVAALWAMLMPWVGFDAGSAGPSCVIGNTGSSVTTYDAGGDTTTVHTSGCVSAYQAVHLDQVGTSSAAPATDPFGAPPISVKYGIPAATFWLVVSAALGALGLAIRNSLVLVPTFLTMQFAHHAFVDQRSALLWGLDRFAGPMRGVTVHQVTYAAVLFLLAAGCLFVAKVNASQRRADMAAFKRGERDAPPALVHAQLVASYLLRSNIEKLSNLAEEAKSDAKVGQSTK